MRRRIRADAVLNRGGLGVRSPFDRLPVGEIPFMLSSHLPQVSVEPLLDGNRQHRP